MAEADVEMPGCPTGPTGPVWPTKSQPWTDRPNPWPLDPQSPNGGGRISPPAGKDPDGSGPGSTGVTNTSVPL
jgi:hypothetical protein